MSIPADAAMIEGAAEEAKSTGRVLWVDDDPNLAAGFARRLKRYNIQIMHAFNGIQGYWMALNQKPDVIVTDLKMPKWPGNDLVECLSLNRELAGIPTIVVSGHAGAAEKKRLEAMGVVAVLEKPVGLEDLLVELRKFLSL